MRFGLRSMGMMLALVSMTSTVALAAMMNVSGWNLSYTWWDSEHSPHENAYERASTDWGNSQSAFNSSLLPLMDEVAEYQEWYELSNNTTTLPSNMSYSATFDTTWDRYQAAITNLVSAQEDMNDATEQWQVSKSEFRELIDEAAMTDANAPNVATLSCELDAAEARYEAAWAYYYDKKDEYYKFVYDYYDGQYWRTEGDPEDRVQSMIDEATAIRDALYNAMQ